MPPAVTPVLETNIQGKVLQWGISDDTCPGLVQFGIRNVGMAEPDPDYRVIRLKPAFSHVHLCLRGSAPYLVNGAWRELTAGNALLFPRHHPQGSLGLGSKDWLMGWVVFADDGQRLPRLPGPETQVVSTDPLAWEWALRGLHREVLGANEADCLRAWTTVIDQLVNRLARNDDRAARLASVWEKVNADLARPWTAPELAKLAGTSEVHLRRLCVRATTRTPMQQVSWLRTRHASFLLQATGHTVESVAWAVGYDSVSAFTSAFKRWHGRPPRGSR